MNELWWFMVFAAPLRPEKMVQLLIFLSYVYYLFVSIQVSHLFDNEGTVAFAMFMAIWGECLMNGDD